MAKNKVSMPSSTAGITSYYGEGRTAFQLQPTHVVALIILVIIVMIMIHAFG